MKNRLPFQGTYDWGNALDALEPQVVLCGEGMPSITTALITVMIPLYKRGDISVVVQKTSDDSPVLQKVEWKQGCLLLFGSEVDVSMRGPGQMTCLLLRWAKPEE